MKEYEQPVDQLLRIGDPSEGGAIVDYASYGFGREHVPELVRMLEDDSLNNGDPDSDEVWAPLHAWRVLGGLRAEEAIAPLLGLLKRVDEDDDDWVADEVPDILAEIGPAMLFPAAAYLADTGHGDWARTAVANAIAALGEKQADQRDPCVAILGRQLERFEDQSEVLNTSLVSALMDLKAVEAVPVMEKVFAAGRVDEFARGDWEDVQIELGLKKKRESERKPNKWRELGDRLRAAMGWGADEANPFFLVMPGEDIGVFRFSTGERAGQEWNVALGCCEDPMCPCWTVWFACTPRGSDDDTPLCFAFCAKDKELIPPSPGAPVDDIKAVEFAKAVKESFRERDWERLAEYCSDTKAAMVESLDVTELAGQFPDGFVGRELAGYEEVFPFAPPFVFECDSQEWTASDLYCIERKCECRVVNLAVHRMAGQDGESLKGPADGILLQYHYRTGKEEVMHVGQPGFPPVKRLLAALLKEYPDFRETVKARHADLRFLNGEAMREQGLLEPVVRGTAKIGRNDPCPCGSGKKHKKCCGK